MLLFLFLSSVFIFFQSALTNWVITNVSQSFAEYWMSRGRSSFLNAFLVRVVPSKFFVRSIGGSIGRPVRRFANFLRRLSPFPSTETPISRSKSRRLRNRLSMLLAVSVITVETLQSGIHTYFSNLALYSGFPSQALDPIAILQKLRASLPQTTATDVVFLFFFSAF